MDDTKFLAIMDGIKQLGERQARTETKIDSLVDRITNIEGEDKRQNELLDEHIKGTVANTERLNLEIKNREVLADAQTKLEVRVNKLELPFKIAKWAKDNIMWLSLVLGGVAGILAFFKHS